MYGSILYNCWAALFGFTVAFITQIMEPFSLPVPTLLSSALWAIVAFVAMFAIRFFLGYVLYTPEEIEYQQLDEATAAEVAEKQQILPNEAAATVEFQDSNSEEVAQVVRTMLHKDEQTA